VVIHDQRVRRTTNGRGYVKDMTLKELKNLDAGKGQIIPTLSEVVEFINKRCMIDIELKADGVGKPVADILRSFLQRGWTEDLFMVSSFDYHELKRFHDLMPQIPFAPIIAAKPLDYAYFAQSMNANAVNPASDFIDREFVQDAHRRGLKLITWTVDNRDDIKTVVDIGVDGIISNYPDRVTTILNAGKTD
jgi:glycerophosphoryl diester phosphodiesterase